MTNGEYLRSLSDEELGKRICDLFGGCSVCLASEHCCVGRNGLVAWAKEESDILPFDKQNSQTTCKDCVSRQAAIERIDEALARVFKEPCGELILRELPSAQPEQRWIPCSDPSDLPKDRKLWITRELSDVFFTFREVSYVVWDMTEWSGPVSGVTAYMPYWEPEPYGAERREE